MIASRSRQIFCHWQGNLSSAPHKPWKGWTSYVFKAHSDLCRIPQQSAIYRLSQSQSQSLHMQDWPGKPIHSDMNNTSSKLQCTLDDAPKHGPPGLVMVVPRVEILHQGQENLKEREGRGIIQERLAFQQHPQSLWSTTCQ